MLQGREKVDRRIPAGYCDRMKPEPFIDVPTGIIHQPQVYDFARYIAERRGVTRIIDIGCGSGEKLRPLDSEIPVTGIDTAVMRDQFQKFVPWAEFIQCDLETALPDIWELAHGAVIICSDVVEHLLTPEVLLRSLGELSRVAAYVLLSTPDRARARGLLNLGPPTNKAHVREWTADEFGRFLLDCGFSESVTLGYPSTTTNNSQKTLFLPLPGTKLHSGESKSPAPSQRLSAPLMNRTSSKVSCDICIAKGLRFMCSTIGQPTTLLTRYLVSLKEEFATASVAFRTNHPNTMSGKRSFGTSRHTRRP